MQHLETYCLFEGVQRVRKCCLIDGMKQARKLSMMQYLLSESVITIGICDIPFHFRAPVTF
jgi:hypothetical protein